MRLGDLLLVEAARPGPRTSPAGPSARRRRRRRGTRPGRAVLCEHGRARAAVDQIQRVDAGAERLGHAATVRGLDDRVHVDVAERDLAGELEAHHDHACDPEEDDVATGAEHVGGIEGVKLRRLLGPAERRERPQRAGEPGIEHVGVALPAVAVGRRRADVCLTAAVPDRDLMAPPELAGDAPRADVLHPVEVDLGPALRVEADAARTARRRSQAGRARPCA